MNGALRLRFLLVAASLLAFSTLAIADPPQSRDPKKPPLAGLKTFRMSANSGPPSRQYSCVPPDYYEEGKDGIAVATSLYMSLDYLKRGAGTGITFPPIRDGDLVPLFGALYKTAVQPGPQGSLTAQWIHPDDYPSGVKLDTDSVAVPLARGNVGHGSFNGQGVRIHEIQLRDKQLEATVGVYKEETFGTVRVGDVFIYSSKYNLGKQVRRIVPPDKMTRIIGWVEFEPDTLKGDELKKHGGRIVRPIKRDTPAIDKP